MPQAARAMFISLLTLWGCGPESIVLTVPAANSMAVTSGATSPDEVSFEINRFERNAVAGVAVIYQGEIYQGCSATLIGDRLAMIAGHCTVANPQEWEAGAQPVTHTPAYYYISIGPDILSPICQIQALSLHIHPNAVPNVGGRIMNDLGLVLLSSSVLDTCEEVVPVQLNRSSIGDSLVGTSVLQGGFGSLNDTRAFSTQRRWSLVAVEQVDETHLVTGDQGLGFPSFGDSGSGLLLRGDQGALLNMGVTSSFVGSPSAHRMAHARTDIGMDVFADLLTDDNICGGVDAAGTCREGAVFSCSTDGFITDDCQARGEVCEVAANGVARCTCGPDCHPEEEGGKSQEVTCAAHPKPWSWGLALGPLLLWRRTLLRCRAF